MWQRIQVYHIIPFSEVDILILIKLHLSSLPVLPFITYTCSLVSLTFPSFTPLYTYSVLVVNFFPFSVFTSCSFCTLSNCCSCFLVLILIFILLFFLLHQYYHISLFIMIFYFHFIINFLFLFYSHIIQSFSTFPLRRYFYFSFPFLLLWPQPSFYTLKTPPLLFTPNPGAARQFLPLFFLFLLLFLLLLFLLLLLLLFSL